MEIFQSVINWQAAVDVSFYTQSSACCNETR